LQATRPTSHATDQPLSAQWQALHTHWRRLESVSPQQWLAARTAEHSQPWVLQAGGVLLDYSRQRFDLAAFNALLDLARASDIEHWRNGMFAGEMLNVTERRAVSHWQWRSNTPSKVVADEKAKLDAWVTQVHSGQFVLPSAHTPKHVLHLGIGGSYLGPLLVSEAIAYCDSHTAGIKAHYVANVDAHELQAVLDRLDPHQTLVTIASKTFTTRETMRNAQSVLEWMVEAGLDNPLGHCVAITAQPKKAIAWGIPETQIFGFEDSVGGRFSVWSPIGLPARLSLGEQAWTKLLSGARDADTHFQQASFESNLPVILALLDVWNHTIAQLPARVAAPYDARLRWLVTHLQQLEMESLGKSLTLGGDDATHAACPMVWGEPGTNSQHAYFQWLHQAKKDVAVELLLVANADHTFAEHQMILLANGIAQADALAYGKCAPRIDENDAMVKFRDLPGGKPVAVWALPRLDAYSLGFMLGCYEHKMLCLGALWNINPFDQFGVELGKCMAADVESYLQTDEPETIPPHLSHLLNWLKCQNT